MRGRPSPVVDALVTLPRLRDAEARRVRWRQAVAALGQYTTIDGPPPLDGIDSQALLDGCQVALATGLVDDLEFIAAGGAGAALYELTSALPRGSVRREFGRRAFSRLYGGTAGAFVSVATRMAWSSVRQLQSATMRARLGLCFALPVGTQVNTGPLALALVSRREHFEQLVAEGSSGTLHARRLAAVVLEQASKEAVRRNQTGDAFPAELLNSSAVRPYFDRLLADREPLVWQHAAVARGLLSAAVLPLREEIDLLLDPALTATEWRRALVSLVACLTHDQTQAMAQLRSVLGGELAKRHPALLSTIPWGLSPVVESEPETAEEVLNALVGVRRQDVAQSVATLLREVQNPAFGSAAAERMCGALEGLGGSSNPLLAAVARCGQDRTQDDATIYAAVRRALVAYETSGAAAAQELATQALGRAVAAMNSLEAEPHSADGLTRALPLLADLDASALERSRLHDLLLLGKKPGDPDGNEPQLELLYERLGNWLVHSERVHDEEADWSSDALLARRQKLVTFLHLLDVHSAQSTRLVAESVRERIRTSIRVLLQNLVAGPDAEVHRVMCAALARSFDAALREDVADVCDLLLLLMEHVRDIHDVRAILEASTEPSMREALSGCVDFLSAVAAQDVRSPSASLIAASYVDFSRGMGRRGSYRGEALRRVLLRIGRVLESIESARGLRDLTHDEPGTRDPLEDLEQQTVSLWRLAQGATRRLLNAPVDGDHPTNPPASERLQELLERAIRSSRSIDEQALRGAVSALVRELPSAIASSIAAVLSSLHRLPSAPPRNVSAIPLKPRRTALPDWLLPRRTIGGFYVLRSIGAGGVSSVFMVKRIEERRDDAAETYALKVPQYDPTTARHLSEQEFLDMFRDEAGALLALPRHKNLARFVNFDLAAKPKPVLVMELIRGHSLERLLRTRALTLELCFVYLGGILQGLAAMHRVGVAHLDVKPSNVILRDERTPVLVDFGLSGRNLRPGCGTPEYCAPEVLGVVPDGLRPEACPADMYAFACTALELLTGQLLFDATEETALITQHISHDGWPEALAQFAEISGLKTLAVILAACLRRDPRQRPGAEAVAAELDRFRASLPRDMPEWPLPLHGQRLGVSA